MSKLFPRLIIVIVLLACAMPFVMKGQDGRPLMVLADIKMPNLQLPGKETVTGLFDSADKKTASPQQKGVVKVYRWQDDQGIWHFSDSINPEGQSEEVGIHVNVSTFSPIQSREQKQQGEPDMGKLLESGALPIFNAGEILDQARNVENLLQQRYQRQEQILSK